MAFNLSAGLSLMGKSIAQSAGVYALETQRNALEAQKVELADRLATARESTDREEKNKANIGLINIQADRNEKTAKSAAEAAADRYARDREKDIEVAKIRSGDKGEPQETFGNPVAVTGPDGKQVFVRPGNKGSLVPVTEYFPAPERGRNLPTAAIKMLSDAGATAQDFERLRGDFKPEYGGKVIGGEWRNYLGRIFGDASGGAQWWQDFDVRQNQIRHALFGSALTETEKADFNKITITPNMSPDEISKNLDRQQALANRAALKLGKSYSASNFDQEAIEGALGMSLGDLNNLDTSGTKPKAATTPATKSGFKFLGKVE